MHDLAQGIKVQKQHRTIHSILYTSEQPKKKCTYLIEYILDTSVLFQV